MPRATKDRDEQIRRVATDGQGKAAERPDAMVSLRERMREARSNLWEILRIDGR